MILPWRYSILYKKSKLVSYIDWQLEKYSALHLLWGPIHLPNKCDNNYIGIYWINYCISERRKCSEGIFWNDCNLHGYFTYWIASLFFCLLSAFVVHISQEDFFLFEITQKSIPALRQVNWGWILKGKQLDGQQQTCWKRNQLQ